MAAQALVAVGTEDGLYALVYLGGAGVGGIGLGGELLVPKADVQSGVGRMTVGAGVGPRTGNVRLAARRQAMDAEDFARLRMDDGCGQQDDYASQRYSYPHRV